MERVLLLLLTIPLFLRVQAFQDDYYVDRLANERLKNSINYGAHDASLQIDPVEWGEGRIVFLHDNAFNAFKATLATNMSLKTNLNPQANTILTDPVEILFQDYIDDSSGVTFPYYYQNTQYGINKMMQGPSVVYVVRTLTPRLHTTSNKGYITKSVVFEYPYP